MIEIMATSDDITGPMNIGNPTEFTILELAQSVIDLTDSKSVIEYLPIPEDDPRKRQPNISLVQKNTQWVPKIELRSGLIRTINYFKQL